MGTLFDPRVTRVAAAQEDIEGVSCDSIYAWFSHQQGSKLSRVRLTDGVMVKSDGTDGDYTNAPVSSGFGNGACGIASSGTHVLQAFLNQQYIRVRLCSDVSYVGDVFVGPWADCYQAIYAHGYFWFPRSGKVSRITPDTWALSEATVADGSGTAACSDPNGFIWTCQGAASVTRVRKISIGDAVTAPAVVATIDFAGSNFVTGLACDGTYLYALAAQASNTQPFIWKVRLSDGLYYKNDRSGAFTATVGEGAFSLTPYRDASSGAVSSYYCLALSNGFLYAGNFVQAPSVLLRINPTRMVETGWIEPLPVGSMSAGGTGAPPMQLASDGLRVWSANGLSTPSHISSFEDTVASSTPNLVSAEAEAGGVKLMFDNTVTESGTTFGASNGSYAVTGMTAESVTVKHLEIDLRPDAPTATATANSLLPPVAQAEVT